MEDTNNDTINGLSEEELKERLNFSKMFNRQEKQIKQTPHIKNLLSRKKKSLEESIHKMEESYQLKSMDSYFKELKTEINNLKLKNTYSLNINLESKKTKKQVLIFTAICSFLFALMLSFGGKEKTVFQEKIVFKEVKVPTKTINNTGNTHFTLKYVNLRNKASSKGKIVSTIGPNTEIKVLESKYGWHKIEYKNHLEDKQIIAWAYGKNISKIKL